jgi:hypothetical protein
VVKVIEVVMNQISVDGMKFVKVISDKAVSDAVMLGFVPGAARDLAQVKCYDTAALSLFYGEVNFPVRGVVEIPVGAPLSLRDVPPNGERASQFGGRVRRLAAWRMVESEGYRMSEIITFLADWYFVQTHRRPQFVFVKVLPKGVERFQEVDDLCLIDVDWALEKCVMVGG